MYLNLAGQNVVVLNTLQCAADLLDRRAAIYSSRPKFVVARQLLTEGLFFVFQGYGDLYVVSASMTPISLLTASMQVAADASCCARGSSPWYRARLPSHSDARGYHPHQGYACRTPRLGRPPHKVYAAVYTHHVVFLLIVSQDCRVDHSIGCL